jgi:hypothetical protein
VTGWRILLGALGLGAAAYGAVQLLDLGLDNLIATAVWLVGGVALHDGVLAPLTLAVAAVAAALWRRPLPAPLVTGAVVLACVTVVAVPVLGRFGARSDNPTLLDRNYVLGWLGLATLIVVVSVTGAVATAARARTKGGADGTGAGRR